MTKSITRRGLFAKGIELAAGAAIGTLASPHALAAPTVAKRSSRPNVLFIAIDDLNDWTGWLGGYPGVRTPNFDRLAGRSAAFLRAYTPAPACKPARASVLFGVEPHRTGIYTNRTGDWPETFLAKRPSIVRWFKDAGYRTIGTGKTFSSGWRGPGHDDPASNDETAWTQFEILPELFNSGTQGEGRWGPSGVSPAAMEDVARAKWMVKNVLSKSHDRPVFASLGIRKPHSPWRAPQQFFSLYPIDEVRYPPGALDVGHTTIATNKDTQDLGPEGREMVRRHHESFRKIAASEAWRSGVQAYLAAISLADHALGVALDGLLAGPNAGNTIVCVWSDHGFQLGEKLSWSKFTLWERATRIPLTIGGPDIRPGRSHDPISTLDIYPTLANLAIGEGPAGLGGADFSASLRNGAKAPRDHVVSSWARDGGESDDYRDDIHFAVRTKRHRLIRYGDGELELYDHRDDPYEWRNIAKRADQREVVAELEARLEAVHPVPPVVRGPKVADLLD